LRDKSSSVTAPDRWMSSSVCALIENGTSTREASRLVAVTTMLSCLSGTWALGGGAACWALAMPAAPIAKLEGKVSRTAFAIGRRFMIDCSPLIV
jgi:hypothetical protein